MEKTEKKKIKIIWKGLILGFKSFFTQEYFKNPIVLWLLGLSFLINLANWIVLKLLIQPVDLPIILHYNVYFGVDMIGDWRRVFLLPSIGLVLFIINMLLSVYFYRQKERIVTYLLLIAVLMIQLSLVIASMSVILINY